MPRSGVLGIGGARKGLGPSGVVGRAARVDIEAREELRGATSDEESASDVSDERHQLTPPGPASSFCHAIPSQSQSVRKLGKLAWRGMLRIPMPGEGHAQEPHADMRHIHAHTDIHTHARTHMLACQRPRLSAANMLK